MRLFFWLPLWALSLACIVLGTLQMWSSLDIVAPMKQELLQILLLLSLLLAGFWLSWMAAYDENLDWYAFGGVDFAVAVTGTAYMVEYGGELRQLSGSVIFAVGVLTLVTGLSLPAIAKKYKERGS